MWIALTADPELPVPPKYYGGIERIIDTLARGLVARGHDVVTFAHPDSTTAGRIVGWPGRSSVSPADTAANAATLAKAAIRDRFDVVHSFSRVAYLAALLPFPVPKLMTYQREISRRSILLGHHLSRGTLHFSAISRSMMRQVADVGDWHLVYNGVPMADFEFREAVGADAPLVFLGRIEEIKGPHIAIQVAQRMRLPLVIAGNVAHEHQAWHERNIVPHIDGKLIRYVGPVDDRQKSALLGTARAFLMPILWEEPFGIVMAEAMACGTPVIGFARGAVPEVVDDGVTGYVVADIDGLVSAVSRCDGLDRRAVRRRAQRLFSDDAVVRGYLSVYEGIMAWDSTRNGRR
jgi:glycosyltransferase involved in cell wall biosynthesis